MNETQSGCLQLARSGGQHVCPSATKADQEIKRLTTEINRLESQTNWILTKDRLPASADTPFNCKPVIAKVIGLNRDFKEVIDYWYAIRCKDMEGITRWFGLSNDGRTVEHRPKYESINDDDVLAWMPWSDINRSNFNIGDQKEFHFFTSSTVHYRVHASLYQCLRSQIKADGLLKNFKIKGCNVYRVPGPADSSYNISDYKPEVEGIEFIHYEEY